MFICLICVSHKIDATILKATKDNNN